MSDDDKTVTVLVGYPTGAGIGMIASAVQPIRVEAGHLTVFDVKGCPIATFSPGYWTGAVVKDHATDDLKDDK